MLVAAGNRHVLFLQGPGSLFFNRFALALRGCGIEVSKIHLSLGDMVFWWAGNATVFRQPIERWPDFVERYIVSHGVSDIVLFSDSRPYHKPVVAIAKGLGVNVFVFENGYFRPDWITFERGGVNGRSSFPRLREAVEAIAARAGDPDVERQPHRLNRHMLLGDWTWHAVNWMSTPLFPHYRRHRHAHPLQELWGATRKVVRWFAKNRRSKARLDALLSSGRPYFFFPLQLDQDHQLTVDSPFASISAATEAVIGSFARHAPQECLLLVKNHPHDSNIVDRERDTARIARRHGVTDRVVYVETGKNPRILRNARGMVTINSTMGTSALWHNLPICTLGRAIYDIEGLTHQGGLDAFWSRPSPPDPDFFRAFRRALVHVAQVRGAFGSGRTDDPIFDECLQRLVVTPYRPAGLSLVGIAEAGAGGRPQRQAAEMGWPWPAAH